MNILDHTVFLNDYKQILGLKVLKFLYADPGSGISLTLDPGSGMEKFGSGMEKFGSGINFTDQQHCLENTAGVLCGQVADCGSKTRVT